MAIYMSNQQKALLIRPQAIKRRLGIILKELGMGEADVSILVVGDVEIQAINLEYRGVDAATNVLAFAMEEGHEMPGSTTRILGDIVISGETILVESVQWDYSPGEMFYFYLVHGLLHLLGYDHELSPEEETRQETETLRLWNLVHHNL